MIGDRKEMFWIHYTAALTERVERAPKEYALRENEIPIDYASRVASKMRASVERENPDFGKVNYSNSNAFRYAAKKVGVPFNRNGLNSIYLERSPNET